MYPESVPRSFIAGVFLAVTAATLPSLAEKSVRDEDQALGKRFSISPESLPKPALEQAVSNPPVTVERGDRQPHVPEGFTVSLFAENSKAASPLASPSEWRCAAR